MRWSRKKFVVIGAEEFNNFKYLIPKISKDCIFPWRARRGPVDPSQESTSPPARKVAHNPFGLTATTMNGGRIPSQSFARAATSAHRGHTAVSVQFRPECKDHDADAQYCVCGRSASFARSHDTTR
jgi:hypothetical protein